MEYFKVKGDFITLGQFLKTKGFVHSGGMVKDFLQITKITLNDQRENRRGKKIFPNDTLKLLGKVFYFVK